MSYTRQKVLYISFFTFINVFFMLSTPDFLKADFRYGVYYFGGIGGGFDYSEDKEVYWDDPNCDMYWGQFEIPYIVGSLIDIGENNFFDVVEAPIENDLDPDNDYKEKQIYMELNHVYIIKTKENCYVKILIISKYAHAMLWVYQDDGSRNLDWRGTTAEVFQEVINKLMNPIEPILMQNYPNPFNPSTEISYTMPEKVRVRIEIYSPEGRKIRTLLDRDRPAGEYTVVWDGADDSSRRVGSGIYVCRMSTGRFVKTIKMAVVR